MKKVVIAVGAIVMSLVAQSATVSWTISNVKDAGGTALTSGSSYVFFMESASAAATQINSILALAGNGASAIESAMASANWNGVKKATAAGNFSMGASQALGGYVLPTLAELGLAGSTSYTVFAVIFDTETITDASKFLITSTVTASTPGEATATNKLYNIGSQGSNNAWQAVPEPTTGLLLLIGMAGLALRRKQA